MPNDARHWVSLSFLFFFLPLLFRLVSAFESLLITIFELLQIFFPFFSPLVEIVLTACSTLWECNILHGGDIQVNQCQLSFGVTWQPWEIWGVGRELCENCLFVLKRRDD